MQIADVEMVRNVRREMSRHSIDTSQTSVHVSHGIVHVNGRVRPIRGHEAEFADEINTLARVLRQRPGIRDVILEWEAEGYDLEKASKSAKPAHAK